MTASQVLTTVFGIAIIVAALLLKSLQSFGLFDLMMLVGTLIGFPVLIPSILCFFIRKTPDWSGWGTVLVGLIVSAIIAFLITPETVEYFLGLEKSLTDREFAEMKSVTLGVIGHMAITMPFFVLSRFFYREPRPARAAEINQFFSNTDTEIVVEETAVSIAMDNRQREMLGKMLLLAALFLSLLVFIPNPIWGRTLFVLIGLIVGSIGGLLLIAAKRAVKAAHI